MCCDPPAADQLAPQVAAMLEAYRALAAERPDDWGEEVVDGFDRARPYARWLGGRLLAAVFGGQLDDWPGTVRACLTNPLPAGLVVATLDSGGIGLRAGPAPYVLEGGAVELAVLLDSHLEEPTLVEVDGTPVAVGAGGVELVTRRVTGFGTLPVGAARAPAGEPAGRARLRLRAGGPSRWSVVDDRGGAWFPEDRLPKWDFHDRPYFHGDDLALEVPAVPLTVACTRGMEFATAETALTPRAGATTEVVLAPERLYETAARGWYGGDLHVHINYSGDLVCGPDDAACMQLGEGLHLMSLVAGNLGQTRVYDREAFEATVGDDLPWTTAERVARFGVEYRNDLLGHFHALGPTGRPARYHSGHAGSDEPFDLRDEPLSVAAFADAIRAGRTLATNGPWVELLVDGRGPGDPVEADAGRRLPVTVRCAGPGVERLELVGPDGALAQAEAGGGAAPAIETTVEVEDSLWLCAVARGRGHPSVLGPVVFAHTSPVWVEVAGRPVRRPASARWLLDWLDRFEALLDEHGRFADGAQRAEVVAVVERARAWYRAVAGDPG